MIPLLRRRRLAAAALLAVALASPTVARGQTSALVDRLQAQLDSLVLPDAVPGITLGVALAEGRSFGLSAGWADTARHVAMTPDARMLQGSVGKTYFGAVALQLVGEGALDLDGKVADYLGDLDWFARIPNAGDVTIRQIMSHTSGIVRYELNPRFLEDLSEDPLRTFTPEERLAYLLDSDPPFAAGEGWDYSDTNYILLAMLIEEVTGNTAYDEIRRRILEPDGFSNTVPSDRPYVPGLVQGYAGRGNPFGGFDAMVEDGRLAINPQFEWGGGGFASTAEDLARWTWTVQEGQAFPARLLEDFRRGTPAPLGPDASYGLGVIMMELPAGTAWGHSGFMPGYRTEAYYFPEGRFALALQVNTSAQGAFPPSPLRMLSDLAALVLAEVSVPG
jgi:D-alanyl-D-alanine carboxypeptidase